MWRMMSFYDPPLADLDAASAADPGWALPHVMKAGFLLSLTEPALVPEAAAHLRLRAPQWRGRAGARDGPTSQAVSHGARGPLVSRPAAPGTRCCSTHPRDALALQWAHLWDFYRGDARATARAPGARAARVGRRRPAAALRAWGCTPSGSRNATSTAPPKKPAARRCRPTRACPGRCTRSRM